MNELIDYIVETYGDENAEKLSQVKLISRIALSDELPQNWKSLVDKIALFNGFEKISKK